MEAREGLHSLCLFQAWSSQAPGRHGKKKRRKENRKDFVEEENGERWFKSALQARWAGGWELGKPLFADVKDTENPHHLLPRKAFSASVIYSPTPSLTHLSSLFFFSYFPESFHSPSLFTASVSSAENCSVPSSSSVNKFMFVT